MKPADLVLINGNIITMNPKQPYAQAVAIKYDKIVEVGTNNEVKPWTNKNTKIIDLKGKTVAPGFIDTHVHIRGFGRSLTAIDLRGINSVKKIQQKLKEQVQKTPQDKWLFGHGWDQERLKEKRYPTKRDLDKVSPNNPVALRRVCGHMCVVNSKALELADITKETKSPPGGKIDKDPQTGEPTGILRENAMDLILKIVPEPDENELMGACVLACQKAVKAGLTGVHWIIDSPTEISVIQKLRAQNKLPLRVYILIPVEFLDYLIKLGLHTGFGDNVVRIGCIKILADGSLGARTAALKEPYSDRPKTKGMMLYTPEELNRLVIKAHKAGFQLALHAIGDHTVEVVLNALEESLSRVPRKNHRHRIEHGSVLNEKAIQHMKKLNLIASVQPHFVVSDFWVADRVGPERARWVYPFKTLIKEGVTVAGGSDCPVEPINPLLGVQAAVARKTFPEEGITVDDALRIYTINAAYASFEEDTKGSIEAGKLADLVVLSKNPLTVGSDKIGDIEVEVTIVGGKVVYGGP
jgi:hypothetical protein